MQSFSDCIINTIKPSAMKRIALASILLHFVIAIYCQPVSNRGEFATNSNGLIYSNNDMNSLRFIVDSLNLRFKTCDLSKTFYSNAQTKVYQVVFTSEKNNLKDIINELEQKPGFESLVNKYASFLDSRNSNELLIKISSGKDEPTYLQGTPGDGYRTSYDLTIEDGFTGNNIKNSWFYTYSEKDKYSKENRLSCRYFPEDWKTVDIPARYGQLIQYVDCMIDTSAYIYLTEKFSGGWTYEEEESYNNLEELINYLDNKMCVSTKTSEKKVLSQQQLTFAIKELKNDGLFRNILSNTIDDYVKNKEISHQLESLAGEFNMYDKTLLLKRSYRIMGYCSQDTRPREHARDIAILAAQSHSWDIFLRAHLDIMNDRFERMIDGSYAWGNRKTYLKELEELNLNIVDLMLGLTLRAKNVADNHYYGTIWRMGWALTESKEKNIFEEKAIAMMKDNSLDEFNRGLIFLLYTTYTNYLDEKEGKRKRDELRKTADSFPFFIKESINKIKEPEKRSRR
jgi:hypothetical protein